MAQCETPENCRIVEEQNYQTTAYYTPFLEGFGLNTNPDYNVSIRFMRCKTCCRLWVESRRGLGEWKQIGD